MVAVVDVSELASPDLLPQHVVVDELRHQYLINISSN